MRKYIIATAILILFSVHGIFPAEEETIREELESFRVTLYSEQEQIPLEGLETLDGATFDISVLRGKYVLLNLGASWCPYCGKEKASLQKLYTGYASEKLTVLAVFVGEQTKTAQKYMADNGYNFPAAADSANRLREAYAPRLPTSYVIDMEGNITARINGNKEWDSEQALRVLDYLINKQ
jgi:peroxiredoxin